MVVSMGSGIPSLIAWNQTETFGLMTQFWSALGFGAIGWYLSRRFVQEHLDL
jgi:hypothetical protein